MFMSLFVFSKVIHAVYRLQKATLHIILRDTHQGQKYVIERISFQKEANQSIVSMHIKYDCTVYYPVAGCTVLYSRHRDWFPAPGH